MASAVRFILNNYATFAQHNEYGDIVYLYK
jgi:hypothetical protein